MANIIDFPVKAELKFGFKKAKKPKRVYLKRSGQLDLFSKTPSADVNIFILPADQSPFEEALMLDEQGNAKRAREAYIKAVKAEDNVADSYCNLGIIEYESGKIVRSIDCFTNALKYDPRHFESHYNLANLYSESGNLPLAKMHYEFAKELKPDFPDVYFNLGLVYAMTKDLDSALKVLSVYRNMATGEDGSVAEKLIASIKKSLA